MLLPSLFALKNERDLIYGVLIRYVDMETKTKKKKCKASELIVALKREIENAKWKK